MAFPAVVSTATTDGTTAAADMVCNLPGSLVSGNLILLLVRDAGDNTVQHTTPAGWTALFRDFSDGSNDQTSAFWKISDGGEGATVTVTAATSDKFAALAYQISGHDSGQAPEFATLATGDSATPDAGSLTPTGGAKDYLFIVVGGWGGEQATPPTYPTNYGSNQLEADSGIAGILSTNCRVAGATRELNAASEDPGAFTISVSDFWTATVIAVHPAAAAGNAAGVGLTQSVLVERRRLAA